MTRPTATAAAIGLAAASAGVVIPSLRTLAAGYGGGSIATGALVAAHVLGGVAGAAFALPLARRLGVRRLAVAAIAASALIAVAIRAAPDLAVLLAGRALEGACHLLGVTTLVACGAAGDAHRRSRAAGWFGMVIVLGVAAGLGAGGGIAAHAPGAALLVAAALAAASAGVAALALDGAQEPAHRRGAPARADVALAPAVIAGAERFVFGLLVIAVPFAIGPRRTGMVLGCFMLASVIVLPLARRVADRWTPSRLARRAAAVLAIALAVALVPGVLAGPAAALWALAGGVAAGALYAAALALVASHPGVGDRLAAMAAVHAAGSAGHAAGALAAGLLLAIA